MPKDKYESLRQMVLERDRFKCASCGAQERLLVHHLSYDLFSDRIVPLKFLITLCNACHGRIPRPNHPFPATIKRKPTVPKKKTWKTFRKIERNRILQEYAKSHPDLSLKEIGEVFGITSARVWRIIHGNQKAKAIKR